MTLESNDQRTLTRRAWLYHYIFVAKDPVLMAMPHRKLIGGALMAVGLMHVVIAFAMVSR